MISLYQTHGGEKYPASFVHREPQKGASAAAKTGEWALSGVRIGRNGGCTRYQGSMPAGMENKARFPGEPEWHRVDTRLRTEAVPRHFLFEEAVL